MNTSLPHSNSRKNLLWFFLTIDIWKTLRAYELNILPVLIIKVTSVRLD